MASTVHLHQHPFDFVERCWGGKTVSILGFHPRDETAVSVNKTIENGSTSFFIIIASNSRKTFYSIVLYTNMTSVTSDETPPPPLILNLVPRVLYLPSSRKEERGPWERGCSILCYGYGHGYVIERPISAHAHTQQC